MTAPYSPWKTRSQFKAVEPKHIVVVRIQYECRSGYDAGTDGSRPASGLRHLPRLNFRGALTALRNRISARVQLRQKTTRGLFKSLSAFRVCVAHDEQHRRKGIGNAGIQVGEFRNV
jgi:hypothetical protein